ISRHRTLFGNQMPHGMRIFVGLNFRERHHLHRSEFVWFVQREGDGSPSRDDLTLCSMRMNRGLNQSLKKTIYEPPSTRTSAMRKISFLERFMPGAGESFENLAPRAHRRQPDALLTPQA